jgi:hypothetical protein
MITWVTAGHAPAKYVCETQPSTGVTNGGGNAGSDSYRVVVDDLVVIHVAPFDPFQQLLDGTQVTGDDRLQDQRCRRLVEDV